MYLAARHDEPALSTDCIPVGGARYSRLKRTRASFCTKTERQDPELIAMMASFRTETMIAMIAPCPVKPWVLVY